MIKIETSLLGERNALLRMEAGQRAGHDEKLKGPGPRSHSLYRPFDLHNVCLLLHGWFAYCPPPLASGGHRAFLQAFSALCLAHSLEGFQSLLPLVPFMYTS